MKTLGAMVRLGSAALAVLITIAVVYIFRLVSYIHVGEPRGSYNLYFRVSLGVSTWLLLFVSSYCAAARPMNRLPALLRAAGAGIGVGYVAGLVAYGLTIFLMMAVDHRSFGHMNVDIDTILPLLAQPLASFSWLFGALAAVVYHWVMPPRAKSTACLAQ